MFLGGLSEKEVETITRLLEAEKIYFEVKEDIALIQANKKSMQNDIRHLAPASISTHILAIEVNDEEFANMSDDLKNKLLTFGITNEVPKEVMPNEKSEGATELHGMLNTGRNNMIGYYGLFVVISIVAGYIAYYLMA